jgi:hypothetical protein
MKKNMLFIFSMIIVGACTKKIVEKTTDANKSIQVTTVQEVIPPDLPLPLERMKIPKGIDENLMVSLQRTACFGKCPVFTVEIFKDGKVTYSGLAHVVKRGSYAAIAEADFIEKIQKRAKEIEFFKMSDKYPQGDIQIVDIPSTLTYIRLGEKGKLITDNYDAPKDLIEFEKWLEKELDTLEWKELK